MTRHSHRSARLTTILAGLLALSSAGAQTELLRFPDIHGDQIAFTYGGDVWTARRRRRRQRD